MIEMPLPSICYIAVDCPSNQLATMNSFHEMVWNSSGLFDDKEILVHVYCSDDRVFTVYIDRNIASNRN